MKKPTKQEISAAILFFFTFFGMIFLKIGLMYLAEKTNSLLWILLDMNTGSAAALVFFWSVILIWSVCDSVKDFFTTLRQAIHTKFFRYFLLGALILLFIPQLFPFSDRFGNIRINGKKPIRLQYNCALLCDAVSGETTTLTLDADQFAVEPHTYSHGSRFGSSHSTSFFACFAQNSVYLYSNETDVQLYLKACQKYQKQLEIVYNKNSCILRSINGIPLSEPAAFINSTKAMHLEDAKKQEEQRAAEEAENEKELARFRAFEHSEGKNYQDILSLLEKDGVENTYETIYISTQYYEIGEIAMFDLPRHRVYVVRDHESEDMVIIPQLPPDGTLTEVTQILDDAGIKWTFDCMGCPPNSKDADHSNDTLNTVSRSAGTPIPKDYVFWFSVMHAE